MRFSGAVLVAVLMTTGVLAGCVVDDSGSQDADEDTERVRGPALTSLEERERLPFDTSGDWSATLEEGPFEIQEILDVTVPVMLPPTEGASAAADMAYVHMGVWLPSNVEDGAKVPVIADIGPYYGDGDNPATEPAGRLGGFLIQNMVPHGYAVAQVSVVGTGQSGHCMDLMGTSEQMGIDAAVTWLGTQDWSNGNVGLTGRSYDGSTPWEAAMFGNPHLKTIAPISGLIGLHELMWRNGTSEWRGGSGALWAIYFTFGFDQDEGDAFNVLCPDTLQGAPQSWAAYATGDHVAPEANAYWAERYFLDDVLENYEGSVYLIQGLQDWNVDPHMAFPTHRLIEQKGLDIKGLYGQWAHMYPDRPDEHDGLNSGRGGEAFPESVRYDWAQDLLEWFNHYLMETGPKPALHAEVQDNQGNWRVEETYPPRNLTWMEYSLGDELAFVSGPESATGQPVIVACDSGVVGACDQADVPVIVFETTEPLAEETRIAGLPQFHVQVTPTGPGGQIFAQLDQVVDGETLRLGHAIMDLRYAAGGKTMEPVAPGQTITAKMEFQAFDADVPAGATLRLTIANTGEDYLPSAVSDPVLIETGADSVLRLSTVDPAPEQFFHPPVWWDEEQVE